MEARGRFALAVTLFEVFRHLLSFGVGEQLIGRAGQRWILGRQITQTAAFSISGVVILLAGAKTHLSPDNLSVALFLLATLTFGVFSLIVKPLAASSGDQLTVHLSSLALGAVGLIGVVVLHVLDEATFRSVLIAVSIGVVAEAATLAWRRSFTTGRPQTNDVRISFLRHFPAASLASSRLDQLLIAPLFGLESLGTYSTALSFHQPAVQLGQVFASAELESSTKPARNQAIYTAVVASASAIACATIITLLSPDSFDGVPFLTLALVPGVVMLSISQAGSAALIREHQLKAACSFAWLAAAINGLVLLLLSPARSVFIPVVATTLSYGWRHRSIKHKLNETRVGLIKLDTGIDITDDHSGNKHARQI